MARVKWISLATLSLVLTGCVSQEKFQALKMERDQLAVQLDTTRRDMEVARSDAANYKAQLAQALQAPTNAMAMIDNLNKQIAALTSERDDLRHKYEDALRNPVSGGVALPGPLNDELKALAAANPDVMDFDAARGVVKFKSDVTFALGSAELESKAGAVIDRFAQILNSSVASGFELMVAGHTDSTPVVRKETKDAGHKDNWYLSAHRAISVAERLMKDGVSSHRLGVAGYADTKPISGTAAQNRRVEVMILPTHSGGTLAGTGSNTAPKTAILNKDSAPAPRTAPRPNLNK